MTSSIFKETNFSKDFGMVQKTLDNVREKSEQFGFFKGIQIRKTKNGQVTIKGLNDEQKERLNYLFTVTRKTV